jgi:hypothetical protein
MIDVVKISDIIINSYGDYFLNIENRKKYKILDPEILDLQ